MPAFILTIHRQLLNEIFADSKKRKGTFSYYEHSRNAELGTRNAI